MPKFTYSASKGIEQTSGQGFVVQDVAIAPSVRSYTASDATANAVDFGALGFAEEVINLTADATVNITIGNGSVIGEQKLLIIASGSSSTTITDAAGTGHIAGSVSAGDVYVFVYTATNTWTLLS